MKSYVVLYLCVIRLIDWCLTLTLAVFELYRDDVWLEGFRRSIIFLYLCVIFNYHFLWKYLWAHTTSFTMPLFIEIHVQCPGSERSCVRVFGVSILHRYWQQNHYKVIDFVSFIDFSILILELFRQYGIFSCSFY